MEQIWVGDDRLSGCLTGPTVRPSILPVEVELHGVYGSSLHALFN
jgi:hypothetical protein